MSTPIALKGPRWADMVDEDSNSNEPMHTTNESKQQSFDALLDASSRQGFNLLLSK